MWSSGAIRISTRPGLTASDCDKLADRAVLPVAASGEKPEEELIEAEEEVAPRDSLPSPELPSQSEIDDHNVDHCPYRSWCRHCVEGRAREMAHRLQDQSSRKISTVSSDYLFITRRSVFTREEWELENEDAISQGVGSMRLEVEGYICTCGAGQGP